MIPYRLCCGKQHLGTICLDNKVMCCYCFSRVTLDELALDDGDKTDVCQECWNREQEQLRDRV